MVARLALLMNQPLEFLLVLPVRLFHKVASEHRDLVDRTTMDSAKWRRAPQRARDMVAQIRAQEMKSQ